jgi:hypothetical protein
MAIAPHELEDLSDRKLRKKVREANETFDRLDASGASREVVEGMEAALQVIEAGNRELRQRRQRAVIDALPARRRLRDELEARAARRAELKPAKDAIAALRFAAPPEVQGTPLDPRRLSHEEGVELLALVRSEEPTAEERERFEELLGMLAGNPDLFDQARRERELAAKANELERPKLPERIYRGRGFAVLPSYVLDWLIGSKDGRWTAADIGALAVFALSFANRTAPFPGSHFEDDVLVVPRGLDGLVLPEGANPGAVDYDASGHVRFRVALDTLARNGWVAVETSGAGLRIREGERLTALLADAAS